MKKIILFSLFLVIISCGDSESEDQNSETSETNNDFPSYVDSNNLRIFARKGVSNTFLNNVSSAYGEMLKDNSKINQEKNFLQEKKLIYY